LNIFYQLTQLLPVMGSPLFALEVTVAHHTVLILVKEYTIKIVCVEIDENCLSHLFPLEYSLLPGVNPYTLFTR